MHLPHNLWVVNCMFSCNRYREASFLPNAHLQERTCGAPLVVPEVAILISLRVGAGFKVITLHILHRQPNSSCVPGHGPEIT